MNKKITIFIALVLVIIIFVTALNIYPKYEKFMREIKYAEKLALSAVAEEYGNDFEVCEVRFYKYHETYCIGCINKEDTIAAIYEIETELRPYSAWYASYTSGRLGSHASEVFSIRRVFQGDEGIAINNKKSFLGFLEWLLLKMRRAI